MRLFISMGIICHDSASQPLDPLGRYRATPRPIIDLLRTTPPSPCVLFPIEESGRELALVGVPRPTPIPIPLPLPTPRPLTLPLLTPRTSPADEAPAWRLWSSSSARRRASSRRRSSSCTRLSAACLRRSSSAWTSTRSCDEPCQSVSRMRRWLCSVWESMRVQVFRRVEASPIVLDTI